MKNMPTYEELLIINKQLGERCHELELIIKNQKLSIQEFLATSTLVNVNEKVYHVTF